jgi:hypothetical protein
MTKAGDTGKGSDQRSSSTRRAWSPRCRPGRTGLVSSKSRVLRLDARSKWLLGEEGKRAAASTPWSRPGGPFSKVSVTTRSTSASMTVRGAPGRGSSSSPARRFVREAAPPLRYGLRSHAQLSRDGRVLPSLPARSPARPSGVAPSSPESRVLLPSPAGMALVGRVGAWALSFSTHRRVW